MDPRWNLTQLTRRRRTVNVSVGKATTSGAAFGSGNFNAQELLTYENVVAMVEGDLQRPDGELVNSLGKTQHSSLIEIRKDFIPEMLKSLEDV